MKKAVKVIIARLGMDAHWRGSVVVARAIRDAGNEVVYMGNQMPDTIVETAMQEDADVIGLSSLSGNHLILAPEVVNLLQENDLKDTVVMVGGTIPPDDVPKLKKMGVAEVFGPGSSLEDIVKFVGKVGKI